MVFRSSALSLACAGLFATGCASVPGMKQPPQARALPSSDASQEEREQAYDHCKVQAVQGGAAWVDGQAYDPQAIRRYYKAMKCRQALSEARNESTSRSLAIALPSALVGVGAVIGFVGEYFSQWTNVVTSSGQGFGPDGYHYYSTASAGQMEQAALIGAGIGIAVGAPLCAYLSMRAAKAPERAAKVFNRSLLKRLELNAVPQPGGVAVKATLNY